MNISNGTGIQNTTFNNRSDEIFISQEVLNDLFTSASVIGIVLALFIIVTNVFLIGTILSSAKLRCRSRNILIISVAITDWLVGAFGCPLKVDFALKKDWVHACETHIALQVLIGHVELFNAMWTLVVLNADYILRQSFVKSPKLTSTAAGFLKAFLVALPWIALTIVVTPTIFEGLHEGVVEYLWTEKICPLILVRWSRATLMSACYFLPAFVLLVLVTTVTIIHVCKKNRVDFQHTSVMHVTEKVEHPLRIVIPTLLAVLLVLPNVILRVLVYFGYFSFNMTVLILFYSFSALADSRSGFLALCWLLCLPDLQQSVAERFKKRGRPPLSPKMDDATVSYSNLAEED